MANQANVICFNCTRLLILSHISYLISSYPIPCQVSTIQIDNHVQSNEDKSNHTVFIANVTTPSGSKETLLWLALTLHLYVSSMEWNGLCFTEDSFNCILVQPFNFQ